MAESRYYYAVENLDTATVVRRGITTSDGIPRNDLILAPNTNYREWLFQAETGFIGFADFRTAGPGNRFTIPSIRLGLPLTPDSDGDGLSDDAEFVAGCNPTNPDTDGDGISDLSAIQLGLGHGGLLRNGILGTVDTPGSAVDVCAFNDVVVVANSASGISVMNVFNRMVPLVIAQVDTPGNATAVAVSGNFIAVADGDAGLAIVDISDPPNARIVHQVDVGGTAQAAAAAGGLGFIGTVEGTLSVVDLATGFIFQQTSLGRIDDLAIEGDVLYAYVPNQLRILTNAFGNLGLAKSIASPGSQQAFNGRTRIFVGGGLAYVIRADGYNRFDVTNTVSARLLTQFTTAQTGWKQLVPNGSGLGIAARGINARDDGSHHVSVYDLSNDTFITEYQTPGVARAVAIYNGLAYIADSLSGLHVLNYSDTDTGTNPPVITLLPSFTLTSSTNGTMEEGKLFRATALVDDDFQVRNVEFYIDGVKAATDGNFPFEFQFIAPRRTTRATFTFQARASDTGGKFTFTRPITVSLTPDVTPPRLVGGFPAHNAIITNAESVFLYFNEPIDLATLGATNVTINFAGADHRFGTLDDAVLSNGSFSFRDSINAAVVSFPSPLLTGQYVVTVSGTLRDIAGNALTNPPARPFWLLPDGPAGDFDNEGLTNAFEVVRGTNPLLQDTDNDGWDDGVEIGDGRNPLDPASKPSITLAASPPVMANLVSIEELGLAGRAITVAHPPVETHVFSREEFGIDGKPMIVSRPPTEIHLDSSDEQGLPGLPITVAYPPVETRVVSFDEAGLQGAAFSLASPPLMVHVESSEEFGLQGAGFTAANPPLQFHLLSLDETGLFGLPTVFGLPPVIVHLAAPAEHGTEGTPATSAQPPVSLRINTNAPQPFGASLAPFRSRDFKSTKTK